VGIAASDYKQQLVALLPPGDAIATDDESTFGKLLTAISQELARVDGQADELLLEVLPSTTSELLADWEMVLGLPDNCANPPGTIEGRRLEVLSRLVSTGGQSRQYFIDVAASLGFSITITEPATHVWDVQTDSASNHFRAGSPAGEPLRTFGGENSTLECRLGVDKPAHSRLTFTHINNSANNWNDLISVTTQHLRSAWYDATQALWVVCGDDGTILTSADDGGTWQAQVSGTTNSLRTVKKWQGNWYIAGHGDGANPATVLKSSDAVNWQSINIGGGDSYLVDIAFNDSKLIFVGWATNAAPNSLLVSTTNGINFNVTIDPAQDYYYGIVWSDEEKLFGIVGNGGALSEWFATSSDAINWTQHIANVSGEIWVIDHIDNTWLLGNGVGVLRTTHDLNTFKARYAKELTGENMWRFTHNNRGVILLCGGLTQGRIMRSIDSGATWTQVYTNLSAQLMSKAVYGPGYWIAVGWSGIITKSTT